MKKFLASALIALTTLSMVAEVAARPMGGSRSFGRQSQSVRQMKAPAPAPAPAYQQQQRPAAQPAPAAPLPQQKPSMWKGILGGALLGLGLGALFSHLGIGGALASALSSILMIGLLVLAVLFIVRMFRRKDTPANSAFGGGFGSPAPAAASATPEIGSGLNPAPSAFQSSQPATGGVSLDKPAPAHQSWGVPADFDTEAFLRHAKSSFIRLQAAWDKGDVNDLREFTSPEVFAELKLQLAERQQADFTDVVSLDAQLLGIEKGEHDYLASVQFDAMIRSAENAPAERHAEVWNLTKPLAGTGGWVLAGIQQFS